MAFLPKPKKAGPAKQSPIGKQADSYGKLTPPPVAAGPGAKPAAGLVREGINYKDVDPGLQSQMAKQAGLVPSAPALPPGVVPPAQAEATEEANEPKAEEAAETPAQEKTEQAAEEKSKSDLEVPAGHTAVAAHTRSLPTSKVYAEKLKKPSRAVAR